ncbi:MAG: hypothetical protein PHG82_05655, partial [Candidatus Gracilibacteria bacterium]|nr:hypothetical protein [Candidatus Gracilibacteria bacterium]
SFFQAISKFKIISTSNILLAIFRSIFSVGLVILGFGIFGAVSGLIIAQIIIIIIYYFLFKNESKNYSNEIINELTIKEDFLKQKKQIFNYLISAISIAFLMNADILFAKHFFDNINAGIYAGLSVIGKLVLFIVFSIETVYYPILTKEKFINKIYMVKVFIIYILVIALSILFFYIFGEKILYTFKPGFELYLNLLYKIFVYSGIIGIISLIIKILIAFEKYKLNYIILFYIGFFIISIFFIDIKNIDTFSVVFLINILIGLIISIGSLFLTKND